MDRQPKSQKRHAPGWMIPGAFFAATVFGFMPATIYFSQPEEFWFSYGSIGLPLLLAGLLAAAVLSAMIRLLPEKVSRMAEAFLITGTVLLYLQGNVMPFRFGSLNGESVPWDAYTGAFTLNAALWGAVLALSLFLAAKRKEKWIRVLRAAALTVTAVQVLSLGALILTGPSASDRGNADRYLSRKGMFELSSGRNTVVFLLDCFDARVMTDLEEADPGEIRTGFEDFTFFRDTAGGATRTKYAIPFLMTGDTNREEQSYSEYLRKAYAESPFFRELRTGAYDTGFYTYRYMVDLSQGAALGNLAGGTPAVSSETGLARDMMKLTAYRCVPGFLARYFWMYSGDFDRWKAADEDGEYAVDDAAFLVSLREQGLRAEGDRPCFRFYHLLGAHAPYTLSAEGERLTEGFCTEAEQARGCLAIVQEYLRRMKECGAYDRSTVIVMADHGSEDHSMAEANPLWMVKPAGQRHPFAVSEMPLSYRSMPEIFRAAVRGELKDLSAYEAAGERTFYVGKEERGLVSITKWVIDGPVWDPENVRETDTVYHADTARFTREYVPGRPVSFAMEDTAWKYILSGFSANEGNFTWTEAPSAELCFELPGNTGDLTVSYTLNRTYHGEKTVRIYANDEPVAEHTVYGKTTRSFRVPGSVLRKGELRLRFEIPDAVSPAEVIGTTDTRLLGLGFESMTITADAQGGTSGFPDLTGAVGTVMGALMSLIYGAVGNYGLTILLFTLLVRILLLPVSLWTHRNGLKMVRMQPEINRLQIRFFGDRDAIAAGKADLFQREKYRPLASLIPLAVQVVILMGVIGAIRHPPKEMEHISTMFLGVDLTWIASQRGGVVWLIPVLTGLSALFLGLAQNRLNPLQHEQNAGTRWGTTAFSTGLSLYLGCFVPAGVALYWIISNLLAVVQQLLLNRLINPKKVIDYQALEETRAELDRMNRLDGGALGRREAGTLRKRENADYRRFFSVSNKHLVFYSESNGFRKYFSPIMEEIFLHSNAIIHYITSDPEDEIFRMAQDNPRLKAYYIGPKKLITLFLRMDADVVVMTMSDLGNYHYKRSYVRRDIRYIYLFHYPLSTHMVLHTGALDHYDEILCVGEFQIPEIRRAEALYGLPPKRLEVCGYCQLDSLEEAWERMEKKKRERPRILVAPSWQEDNLLDSCLDPLLKGLLGRGWDVTVRPHPEYMKRYRVRMEEIIERWKTWQGGDLFFETDFTSSESIYASDAVITDWSGTATEFAFITLRPCLFIDTPPKINNPEYEKLGIVPQELLLRDQIGVRIGMAEAGKAGGAVERLLTEREDWSERIREIRDRLIANFPHSAPVSARAILTAVIEEQERRKREEAEGRE